MILNFILSKNKSKLNRLEFSKHLYYGEFSNWPIWYAEKIQTCKNTDRAATELPNIFNVFHKILIVGFMIIQGRHLWHLAISEWREWVQLCYKIGWEPMLTDKHFQDLACKWMTAYTSQLLAIFDIFLGDPDTNRRTRWQRYICDILLMYQRPCSYNLRHYIENRY